MKTWLLIEVLHEQVRLLTRSTTRYVFKVGCDALGAEFYEIDTEELQVYKVCRNGNVMVGPIEPRALSGTPTRIEKHFSDWLAERHIL